MVTVSKALRGFPGPSEETRARVLSVAKEMNYGPNLVARALVSGRTYSIGLVIPDLVHPFFAQIAKSIAAVLHERGYSLIVSSSEENPDMEKRAVEQLVARSVDGLLIASTQAQLRSCAGGDQQIPYVLVDRKFEGLDANLSAWTTCAWELWVRSIYRNGMPKNCAPRRRPREFRSRA